MKQPDARPETGDFSEFRWRSIAGPLTLAVALATCVAGSAVGAHAQATPLDRALRRAERMARDGDVAGAALLLERAFDRGGDPTLLREAAQLFERADRVTEAAGAWRRYARVVADSRAFAEALARAEALVARPRSRASRPDVRRVSVERAAPLRDKPEPARRARRGTVAAARARVAAAGTRARARRRSRAWAGWAIVLTGSAAASLVATSITGVLAHEGYAELSRACGAGACAQPEAGSLERTRNLQTATDVLLGTTVGLGVAALASWVLPGLVSGDDEPRARDRRRTLAARSRAR